MLGDFHKQIDIPENIDIDSEAMSQLSKDEQERLSKLMIEYKEFESPKIDEIGTPNELVVPMTPGSIINEDAVSRIDEIDETLRQLVPINKWEQWSLKTSIRSITTDSLMAESAPSKILEGDNTLNSLSIKNK